MNNMLILLFNSNIMWVAECQSNIIYVFRLKFIWIAYDTLSIGYVFFCYNTTWYFLIQIDTDIEGENPAKERV